MSVIIETSIGDVTVDLYTEERPRCCLNFLKLCKMKYFNFSLFHTVQKNLVAQTGDPTATGRGGESIFGLIYGEQARFFEMEVVPRILHNKKGLLSMVNNGSGMHGSQFFITLADDVEYLNGKHTVFGEVAEGEEIVDKLNNTFCDEGNRPHQDIRIYHTIILDDPYDDPNNFVIPSKSPQPTQEMLDSDRIPCDADIMDEEGLTEEQLAEMAAERDAKANTQILEMVGDLPDQEMAPPENVLFVCKLNPVTTSDDLEIIFSRFGNIVSCEVIKDQKTGESLQYAFVEFEIEKDCETAYFKMDNVLIDDRRIHVDFSQSVSKLKWKGKGKGVEILKDGDAPKYVLKDRERKSVGYDLVYDHDEVDEKALNKSKSYKKQKSSRNSPEKRSRDDRYQEKYREKRNEDNLKDSQQGRSERSRNGGNREYNRERDNIRSEKFDDRKRRMNHEVRRNKRYSESDEESSKYSSRRDNVYKRNRSYNESDEDRGKNVSRKRDSQRKSQNYYSDSEEDRKKSLSRKEKESSHRNRYNEKNYDNGRYSSRGARERSRRDKTFNDDSNEDSDRDPSNKDNLKKSRKDYDDSDEDNRRHLSTKEKDTTNRNSFSDRAGSKQYSYRREKELSKRENDKYNSDCEQSRNNPSKKYKDLSDRERQKDAKRSRRDSFSEEEEREKKKKSKHKKHKSESKAKRDDSSEEERQKKKYHSSSEDDEHEQKKKKKKKRRD